MLRPYPRSRDRWFKPNCFANAAFVLCKRISFNQIRCGFGESLDTQKTPVKVFDPLSCRNELAIFSLAAGNGKISPNFVIIAINWWEIIGKTENWELCMSRWWPICHNEDSGIITTSLAERTPFNNRKLISKAEQHFYGAPGERTANEAHGRAHRCQMNVRARNTWES